MPQVGYGDGVYVVHLHNPAALANNIAETTIQDHFIVPFASRLLKIQVIGTTKAGTTDPEITLYKNTTEIVANKAIATNDTVYSLDLLQGAAQCAVGPGRLAFSKDDVISMRVKTHAADGALTAATAICTFKSVTPWIGKRFLVEKISVPNTTIGSNVSLATEQGFYIVPGDCELVMAKFISDNITANATMALYVNGTIKTGDTTIAADDTVYTATMVPQVTGINSARRRGCKLKRGDQISLRCYTDGTGDNVVPSATVVMVY